ncbi:GNAT family N-acetyltransferase [Sinisalibacter aestuarii]|uniref:N-acetyltransferase domain-containing protein n=1 Tax=Sinisalibacter aestuarii TaxID=2949426 RepID=A0ABQ5LUN6_9RHOB|nr:GNAT family N-acetyltransferase [Sinisalibacter aestuarii]GKY88703.1 hypothetical protein STA1M1_25720 [Sinisalibacter aestuarii]
MSALTLAPLSRDAGEQVRHLDLRDEQSLFVAPIDQMLAEPTQGVDFHVIRDTAAIVGFFKIDPPGISTFTWVAPDEIGLRGLLIGAQYQGRGHGRAFAAALPAYLAACYTAPRATLAVDEANPVARRLYLAGGWQDSGERIDTRAGPAHIMRLDLAALR